MSDYKYAVSPPSQIFDTRHEAVGFAAVHDREYTYWPLSSVRNTPVELEIEAFEVD